MVSIQRTLRHCSCSDDDFDDCSWTIQLCPLAQLTFCLRQPKHYRALLAPCSTFFVRLLRIIVYLHDCGTYVFQNTYVKFASSRQISSTVSQLVLHMYVPETCMHSSSGFFHSERLSRCFPRRFHSSNACIICHPVIP